MEMQVRAGRVSREDVCEFWAEHRHEYAEQIKYFPIVKDAYGGSLTVRTIYQELGLTGKYVIKQIRGHTHIVFKGFAGARQFFTGTHYGIANHKIIHLRLGKAGLKAAAREGLIFGILFCTAIDIVDFATRDHWTWSEFFGTVGMDVMKGLIASGAGYLAGIATAAALGTTVIALGPVVVAVAIGAGVAIALEIIDKKFDISGKLNRLVDHGLEKLAELGRALEARALTTYHRIEHSQVVRDLSRETHELMDWAGNHMPRIMWGPVHP